MTIRVIITCCLSLTQVLTGYSQDSCTSSATKNIAGISQLVMSIDKDSSMIQVTVDSITQISKPFYKISRDKYYRLMAWYKNGQIQRARIIASREKFSYPFFSSNADYYFHNNQLVFFYEKYMNCARMGSCGCLTVENRVFFCNNKLLKSETKESPFECYNLKIHPSGILQDAEVILAMLRSYFQNQYPTGIEHSAANE